MQVALLGRGTARRCARGCGGRPPPGREGGEEGSQPVDRAVGPADHQAVAALQAPHAAAGAAVDVVDLPAGGDLRAVDVVAVGGVAAVDDRVAGLQQFQQFGRRCAR